MHVKHDPETRAAYVHLRDTMVFVTRRITDSVLIDLDADGEVVGVELLNVNPMLLEIADHDCQPLVVD